ncbi:33064_t:CDS:2, partial [Gigaspora margarita]
ETRLQKSKVSKTKTITSHTMPFCLSAARAKNVSIMVTCVECERPRLLFSAKKLSKNEQQTLKAFLDTIIYTCGISFNSISDPANAITKQPINVINECMTVEDCSENEDNEFTGPSNFSENYDYESSGESGGEFSSKSGSESGDESEYTCDNNSDTEITTVLEDPIQKIFEKVFVNNSWSCNSPVEKPYYSARIYPIVCYQCGSKEIYRPEETCERPLCSNYGSNVIPKKCQKWKPGSNKKSNK